MSFTLAANTTYIFDFWLPCTANAATVGIQYDLVFSGTQTRVDAVLEYWNAANVPATISVVNDTASPVSFNPTASQGTGVAVNRISGRIVVGASGGTFKLQHASETATLTTILAGMWAVCIPA